MARREGLVAAGVEWRVGTEEEIGREGSRARRVGRVGRVGSVRRAGRVGRASGCLVAMVAGVVGTCAARSDYDARCSPRTPFAHFRFLLLPASSLVIGAFAEFKGMG